MTGPSVLLCLPSFEIPEAGVRSLRACEVLARALCPVSALETREKPDEIKMDVPTGAMA